MKILFLLVIALLSIFSYGFRDPNLVLTASPPLQSFMDPLFHMVYYQRPLATVLFFLFIISLFGIYLVFLHTFKEGWKKLILIIVLGGVILSFSYPALTYDLFNYMTTAKVTFTYHENPYVVMPIEIPNEPYLAFTRAANKVALYGPVWIVLTAIPHFLGNKSIWQTIIMFKLMNLVWYFAFLYLIYRATKSIKNVLFFALNPLILIETLVSGHNDIYMMLLACAGLYLWQQKNLRSKLLGVVSLFASMLIKGATVVLLPLLLIKNIPWNTLLRYAYVLLAIVFFIVAPLREELYPWYAVWLIGVASLMDMKKNGLVISFTIVLSFALELRHLPYMWMGYYEGPGPMLRTLVTGIPIGIYIVFTAIKYFLRKTT